MTAIQPYREQPTSFHFEPLVIVSAAAVALLCRQQRFAEKIPLVAAMIAAVSMGFVASMSSLNEKPIDSQIHNIWNSTVETGP